MFVIELCSFCPKSDDTIAPNTYQKMTIGLIDKLIKDLQKINFEGAFCLCGYGEPMLHKDFYEIVNKLGNVGGVEIITNGDMINKKSLLKLYNSKATKLIISLYDGPEQIQKFKKLIYELDIPEDFVILRDRWYSDKIDYGVKLTNRVGTVSVGNQPEIKNFSETKCFYTAYQMLIDWNGDVFLCPQDWQRRQTMGNIMQTEIFDIWKGPVLSKFRRNLLSGKRNLNPCNQCNADGMVYGEKHFKAWIDNPLKNKKFLCSKNQICINIQFITENLLENLKIYIKIIRTHLIKFNRKNLKHLRKQ